MAVLAICMMMSISGCGREENLLISGDFERETELQKSPEGWRATVVPQFKDFVAFEWDDQVAHSGKRSVLLAISADHPDELIHYNWYADVPACRPGGKYRFSGWIKTEDLSSSAVIMFQFWDEGMAEMLGNATTQKHYSITGTSDWTKVEVEFTVPEDTGRVVIRAGMIAPDNRGGKAWFDDLRIVEIR
jgi:hypothetical protein